MFEVYRYFRFFGSKHLFINILHSIHKVCFCYNKTGGGFTPQTLTKILIIFIRCFVLAESCLLVLNFWTTGLAK